VTRRVGDPTPTPATSGSRRGTDEVPHRRQVHLLHTMAAQRPDRAVSLTRCVLWKSGAPGARHHRVPSVTHSKRRCAMILIVVKYRVKPEAVDTFLDEVAAFTAATRAEPGNLWFEWSRNVERDDEFVLSEAFKAGAGEAHVNSDHFRARLATRKPRLHETPQNIRCVVGGEGWDRMGELAIDE